VIGAVAALCCDALNRRGKLVIGDGPQNDADFDEMRRLIRFEEIEAQCARCPGVSVEMVDFRTERWVRGLDGVTTRKIPLPGDPRGFVGFDLAGRSEFTEKREYYGADVDYRETQRHHDGTVNRYVLSRTALEADVFINLPKLKTHKKAGATLSLKSLVGIHGDRNYLPHHVMGTPRAGGDEYPDTTLMNELQSFASRALRRAMARRGGAGGAFDRAVKGLGYRFFGSTQDVVRSGNWYGNDTTWRMALDLNKIFFYGDASGVLSDVMVPRRYVSIVDGIVGGEGDGPLSPDPRPCGFLVGGVNPVAVDCVCARLMGFDHRKIPLLRNALAMRHLPLAEFRAEDIEVRSNRACFDGPLGSVRNEDVFHFEPHFGWKGHVELE
jgi:uncharacterized protein (DUF362 family)